MGVGPDKVPVQWASSAVFAVANTQRRSIARGAAVTYLAWDRVSEMTDVKADPEFAEKARTRKPRRAATSTPRSSAPTSTSCISTWATRRQASLGSSG